MSLEQMTYKMQPAGHEEQQPKREYATPSSELEKAFEKWLNSSKNDDESLPFKIFSRAEEIFNSVDASMDEAHSLILKNQDNPGIANAGYFLSCIYNKSDEKQIVYDLDVPLAGLGYKLPENKCLINKTHGSRHIGHQAAGLIVNYGDCQSENSSYGFNLSGTFVNYGKIKGELGRKSTGDIINCGDFHGTLCPMSSGLAISFEGFGLFPVTQTGLEVQAYCNEGLDAIHGHRGIDWYPQIRQLRDMNEFREFTTTKEYQVIKRVERYLAEMKKEFAKGKEDCKAVFDALKKYPKDEVRQYIVNAIDEAYRCKVKH